MKAGLLVRTGRGKFHISTMGLELLKSNPTRIDIKFLKRYPDFQEFKNVSDKNKSDMPNKVDKDIESTPEETFETSFQDLRQKLAQDLLDKVKACTPSFFEQLVVDLLVAMGYGGLRKDAGEAVGQSGDGGIDGIIKEDKLGLDVIYIQAKKWDAAVGRPVVQTFAGSLDGQRARKGVLITTSRFSQDAQDYVGRIEKRIILIDGEQLAQLMIDHDIGVAKVDTYVVKKIDLDYFDVDQ